MLTYRLPAFGDCDRTELDSLQIMRNKAARILTNTHHNDLYEKTGWMTARQLVWYHSAFYTYRIRKNEEPEYLAQIVKSDNRNGKIIVPNSRLSLLLSIFCFRAAFQWNKLPGDVGLRVY